MKTKLLILFYIFFGGKFFCQTVVFCPTGAEWHYEFTEFYYMNTISQVANEKIKYLRDSIIDQDTCKVLWHTRYYAALNTTLTPKLTVIKQKGDSIFFRNRVTQNTWQLLYNFGAQPGQSWTHFYVNPYYNVLTNTISVNSVSVTAVNGFNLKRLNVTILYKLSDGTAASTAAIITERFGSNIFLLGNYPEYRAAPLTEEATDFLCYSDASFGSKKFTQKPCDFFSLVGLSSEELSSATIKVFPNPITDELKIVMQEKIADGESQLQIVNAVGREVYYDSIPTENREIRLNLKNFESGIYFLKIYKGQRLLAVKKIFKV